MDQKAARSGIRSKSPDASPASANWINIRLDLWDSFQRGDTVCVHVGTGILGIPWYAVDHCAED